MSARPRFDCPVPWCEGGITEHGGDGGAPDTWLHQSAPLALDGDLWAEQWAVGGGPSFWSVNAGTMGPIAEGSAGEIADALERAAWALRGAGRSHPSSRGKTGV